MTEASPDALHAFQEQLGYQFREVRHLEAALTHSSALGPTQPRLYERLEFLGDAVVGLVVSDLLIACYPEDNEGRLSKFRAALVNTASLAAKARELRLNRYMTLGKGEEKTGGREKASILAGAYEAVMGALFLDAGYEAVRAVIGQHFAEAVAGVGKRQSTDAKTELQELCQQTHRLAPAYRLVEEAGPDHARRFVVDVRLGERILARGEGSSKRAAEQEAARRALQEARAAAGEPTGRSS